MKAIFPLLLAACVSTTASAAPLKCSVLMLNAYDAEEGLRLAPGALPHIRTDGAFFDGELSVSTYGPDAPGIAQATEAIVGYANRAFIRRGWSAEFLAERLRIAAEFAAGSEYAKVAGTDGGILGTLGVSVAGERLPLKLMPMEKTHGWRIASPFKMELRTYAMDPDRHVEIFPELFAALIGIVRRRMRDYPELLHEKVLFTYGDMTSIRLYRRMGFEIAADLPPVEHEGTRWFPLAVSPSDLFANHERIQSLYEVVDPGKPTVIRDAEGRVFAARKISFSGAAILSAKLAESGEFRPGARIRAGGILGWHPDGKLRYASGFESEATLAADRRVAEGGLAAWHPNGNLSLIQLARDTDVGDALPAWAAKNAFVHFLEDGRFSRITELARDSEILPGVWAAKGSSVERSARDGSFRISRLARPFGAAPAFAGAVVAGVDSAGRVSVRATD